MAGKLGLIAAVGALWRPDMSSALNSVFAKAVFQLVQRRLQAARLPTGIGIGAGFFRKDIM
jgi:hypothetical protein